MLAFGAAQQINSVTAGRQFIEAAKIVYQTDKYSGRGEFGELVLHVVLRQFYGTLPAISKLYVKTGVNETVRGFDAVHVTVADGVLELWLGEVKFYQDPADAIRKVIEELADHLESDYLRNEFILISNKVDTSWPYHADLIRLIAPQTSLDQIFTRIHVPVFITYNSAVLGGHTAVTPELSAELNSEVHALWKRFADGPLPGNVLFHFITLPLVDKELLLNELHDRLRILQKL